MSQESCCQHRSNCPWEPIVEKSYTTFKSFQIFKPLQSFSDFSELIPVQLSSCMWTTVNYVKWYFVKTPYSIIPYSFIFTNSMPPAAPFQAFHQPQIYELLELHLIIQTPGPPPYVFLECWPIMLSYEKRNNIFIVSREGGIPHSLL